MGSPALPILSSVEAPSDVKAQAWDDFHTTFTPDQFKEKFDALPLPREAKAALWEAKFGGSQAAPAPAQAEAPVDPSALIPPASADEPALAPPPQAPPPVQQPLPSRPSPLAMSPKPVSAPPVSPINQAASVAGPVPLDGSQQSPAPPAQKVPLNNTPALNPNGPQAPPSADAPVPLPPQPAQAQKQPDIYEQAKSVAATTPSFGPRLLAAKLGIQFPQATTLLDKMESEGVVKRFVLPSRKGPKVVYSKVSGSPFPPESAGSAPGAVTAAPGSASDDLLNGQPTASVNLGGHPVVIQRQGAGQNFAIKDPTGQDLAGISIKKPGVGQEIKRLVLGGK